MNRKNFKLKERQYIYEAKTPDEVSFLVDRIELPSGKEFDYVHVECPYEVVFTVGLDEKKHVLLLRQYRYLVDRELLEIPAGSPNPGESVEEGAHREFEEESGYKIGRLVKLGSFFSSVGLTNQVNHVYLAMELEKSVQHLEEAESIEVLWMPLDEAVELVRNGQIMSIGTAHGLLLADIWLEHQTT